MPFSCALKSVTTPWLTPLFSLLMKSYKETRLGHGLLLTGSDGVGKFKFAQQVSKYLLCENRLQLDESCGHCHACNLVKANTHVDLHLLKKEEGKQSISIDQIRELTNSLNSRPQLGENKVVIIKDVQFLTVQAANALLKTLEEPQANTFIILLASTHHDLLPTLLSRVQHTHIHTPDQATLLNWLNDQGLQVADKGLLPFFKNSPLALLNHLQSDSPDVRKQCIEGLFSILHKSETLFDFSKFLAESVDKNLQGLFFLLHDLHKLKINDGDSDGQFAVIYNFALPQLIIWQKQITLKALRKLSADTLKTRKLLMNHSALKKELLINALLIDIKNEFTHS